MEIRSDTTVFIEREISWFESVVDTSLKLYFKSDENPKTKSIFDIPPPEPEPVQNPYTRLIETMDLDFEERLVLILSLLPFLKPQSLDLFRIRNESLNCEFSEFGGIRNPKKHGFQPTLETACFIMGGHQLKQRRQFINKFDNTHPLFKKGVLDPAGRESFGLHNKLEISKEYLRLFLTGKPYLPQYSSGFPAKRINTEHEWEDLVINKQVRENLEEIKDWLLYHDLILNEWNFRKDLKPGYRVLFYGPPGTGKTLAATLIGKVTQHPVYRVDLSLVVSKYIGETEKNLSRLFDEAESKNWVLFFDEADALFGKRTQTKGANDRYANQEIAYLLQRIENYAGLIVLATNIQSNIDEAFARRFQNTIYFPRPGKHERKILWQRLFGEQFDTDHKVDFDSLSSEYELNGGEMINILRYCTLEAARRNEKKIYQDDIIRGIQKEYNKINKTI